MKTALLSMGAVLAVCLGSSADLKAAESLWASQAPLPAARFGPTTCVVDGKIYAMGGGSYVQGSLSRTDIYDPATDTWQPGPKLSKAKYFMGASFVGGRIFIVGGSDAGSGLPWEGIATVETYTPPPALSITRQGGSIMFSWTGILQELDGPVGWQWRDILSSPTSPWTIEADQQNPMNCFRSRLP